MTGDFRLGAVAQVSLQIRDVARAEAFYGRTLGLPHVFTFGDLAFFDAGGLRIYLQRQDESAWRPSSVLYFLVEDMVEAHDELVRRGVNITSGPNMIFRHTDTGIEEWLAFFEDGEGNMLAITSRVARTTSGLDAAGACAHPGADPAAPRARRSGCSPGVLGARRGDDVRDA